MLRSVPRQLSRLALVFVFALSGCSEAHMQGQMPAPQNDEAIAHASGKQTAVFAGGCFWGTQAVFQRVKGVIATTAGYSGGTAATATYDQVTTETTGHAESVKGGCDP